ncbi:MAG: hypothetical protein ABID61_03620 [Candidatus Micrarchaeota archaeon]
MKNKYLLAVFIGLLLLMCNTLLSAVFNIIFPTLQSEYVNPVFRPWTDPIMSLFFLYPVVLGVILTYLWIRTKKSWKNGIDFGVVLGILMAVPSFIVNVSSFSFSLLMVGSWTLFGFVSVIVAGLALEKLEK